MNPYTDDELDIEEEDPHYPVILHRDPFAKPEPKPGMKIIVKGGRKILLDTKRDECLLTIHQGIGEGTTLHAHDLPNGTQVLYVANRCPFPGMATTIEPLTLEEALDMIYKWIGDCSTEELEALVRREIIDPTTFE